MIQRFFNSLLKRRHFWRYASFDEVAELYISRLLRTFAVHMVSLFIVVYLYNQGYSLVFIALYLAFYFLVKIPWSFLAAAITGWFGPKRMILLANLLYIPAMIAFTMVPEAGAPQALLFVMLFGGLQSLGATIYDYAYLVNFSKVKHAAHAGKELGYMHIVEKVASIVSPVVGGILATTFSPVAVMIVAACLFASAALPLLRTAEQVKTRQRIRWSGYPWRTTWRSIVSQSGVGFDVVTTGSMWSLFLLVMVFASQSDSIYAIIGVLTAIGMTVAFISAFVFGKLIDRKAGGMLLKYGVIAKSLSHVMRPLTGNMVGAVAINAGSEVVTTAYSMSFMRGVFDVADYSGFRLTYLLLIEISVNIGASLAGMIAALLFYFMEPQFAFTLFFVAAAGYILIIATPQFTLYKR